MGEIKSRCNDEMRGAQGFRPFEAAYGIIEDVMFRGRAVRRRVNDEFRPVT